MTFSGMTFSRMTFSRLTFPRLGLWAAAAVLSVSPALAQQRAAPAGAAAFPNLACAAPFVKDASHALMRDAFGPGRVAFQDVDGPEGAKDKATVIYGKDATRRLEMRWADGKKRSGLLLVQIKDKSRWIGPNGLRLGMPLDEVEKLNGRAFPINGFGWDMGGFADLSGSALQKPPGGCHVGLRFEPTAELAGDRMTDISGDRQIASDNPTMRDAKPVLTEINIGYAFK